MCSFIGNRSWAPLYYILHDREMLEIVVPYCRPELSYIPKNDAVYHCLAAQGGGTGWSTIKELYLSNISIVWVLYVNNMWDIKECLYCIVQLGVGGEGLVAIVLHIPFFSILIMLCDWSIAQNILWVPGSIVALCKKPVNMFRIFISWSVQTRGRFTALFFGIEGIRFLVFVWIFRVAQLSLISSK
jgi:hypothetical protein